MTIFKKILYTPLFLYVKLKVASMARKHRKDPKKYSQQKRNDIVVKYAEKVLKLYKIKVNIHGYENIPSKKSVVFMPNHASYVDSFVLMFSLKKQTYDKSVDNKIATFLAKEELKRSRLIKNILDIIDTVYLQRENPRQALQAFAELGVRVKEKHSYPVIFPSGTRVKNGAAGEFKQASFTFPKKEAMPIMPVTIKNSAQAFKSGKRNEEHVVDIYFHKVIHQMSVLSLSKNEMMNKVHKIISSKL